MIRALALCLLLTGCASLAHNPDEWTRLEKIAFAYSAGGHAVDLASSVQSDERCIERNLVLGDNPSNAALIVLKAFALAVERTIYNSPKIDSRHTHWFGFVSGTIHLGAGVSNYGNDCYE